MAAVFYNSSQNESLFKGDIAVVNAVQIDFLRNFVGPKAMAIITSVGAQNGDIFQYFITFDDVISYFYFGRGIGTINISGIIFADCRGQMNGLNNFYMGAIGPSRGRPVNVSIGRTVFRGVISSFTTNTVADPNYMSEFTVTVQVLAHNIPAYVNAAGRCATRLRQPTSNVNLSGSTKNSNVSSATPAAGTPGFIGPTDTSNPLDAYTNYMSSDLSTLNYGNPNQGLTDASNPVDAYTNYMSSDLSTLNYGNPNQGLTDAISTLVAETPVEKEDIILVEKAD